MTQAATDQAQERLEIKLAYQEAALQALDSALIAQAARIEQLERAQQWLIERLRGNDASGGLAAPSERDEPPPHY
jgi:uncharacterized coiled-coil protein SlyX